jgi:hypothetical protein
MRYLLALSILAASVLLSGCVRSYNSSSNAYRNRSYSTYSTSSHQRHREHGSRGSGGQGGHIITTMTEITTVAKAATDRSILRGLSAECLPGKNFTDRLQRVNFVH